MGMLQTMKMVGLAGMLLSGLPAQAAELLMFESPGCHWCAKWHAEVGPAYPKSAEGQQAPLRVVQLSAAASLGVALAAPVTATPTFVLIDGGGETGRIVGYPGADFFWGLFEQLLKKLPPAPAAPLQQRADAVAVVRPAL